MSVRAAEAEIRAAQAEASDPGLTVWVSANAGSGKTHVLAQRVVRLLLGRVPPSRVLCLTYTKAAAANMSARIFRTLSSWTTLDDAALALAISATGAPAPHANDLAFARKLFARTIETPGGLKIQTIHAFCDRLLHLFPFEANVAAGFEQLDDAQREAFLLDARQEVYARASHDADLAAAVAIIAEEIDDENFGARVADALKLRLAGDIDAQQDAASLRVALGLAADATYAKTLNDFLAGMPAAARLEEMAAALESGTQADSQRATTLRTMAAAAAAKDAEGAYVAGRALYLTQNGTKVAKLITATPAKRFPAAQTALSAEQERYARTVEKLAAVATVSRTQALLLLVDAVILRYEARKAARGKLDFDDLIARTRQLLDEGRASWVLYKLDSGIDHVLVDEAQDLSPAQWDVLERLIGDFYSGHGARGRRTFFAVGDPKQSIFSFQGAQPGMFGTMRNAIVSRAERAEQTAARVRLHTSFRSVERILNAVDKVFSIEAHYRGLEGPDDHVKTVHTSWKGDLPGLVEIWPAIAPSPGDPPRDWLLPRDAMDETAPPARVAALVAAKIAELVAPASRATVLDGAGKPRPVTPGDIIVLVRKRSAFFDAVIKALKDRDVRVAGADRLVLTQHIAVMDLIAAGRAALLAQDDLALACVLKSPLFDLTDDDLLALAPGRAGSLDAALAQAADGRMRAAADRLVRWRAMARARTPFAFYMAILADEGGRAKFRARLGDEASDAIDEFVSRALAHERDAVPSLTSFLTEMDNDTGSVKRDMDASMDAVRVMTVHAAKGLEAKIVFLPDTCSAPQARQNTTLFSLPAQPGTAPGAPRVVAWSQRKDDDCDAVRKARVAAQVADNDEYRRLLYVALTRAEERLYIAGFEGGTPRSPSCWYDMISLALDGDLTMAKWNGLTVGRFGDVPRGVKRGAVHPEAGEAASLPAWLHVPAPREAMPEPPLSPASAFAAADAEPPADMRMLLDEPGRQRLRRGILAHRLLHRLPDLAAAERATAARQFLAREAADISPGMRARLVGEVVAVMASLDLAPLFATGSVGEAAIVGRIPRDGREPLLVNGRIDRLSVTADAVWLADYKTGAQPAGTAPPHYTLQLGLYRAVLGALFPDKPVRAVIVWTQGPTVVALDAAAMDEAVAAIKDR